MRHLRIYVFVTLLSPKAMSVRFLVHGKHVLFINICFLNNTFSDTHVKFPLHIMIRILLYYYQLFYDIFLHFESNICLLIQLFFSRTRQHLCTYSVHNQMFNNVQQNRINNQTNYVN